MSQNINSSLVSLVYRTHNTWLLQVAFNLTLDRDKAEDLVQEAYVYLLEMENIDKIKYGNTVNLFYLYKLIKSKFLNSIKQNKKVTIVEVNEDYLNIEDQEYSLELDAQYEYKLEHTLEILSGSIFWYDSKLLLTYINEEHSINSLHLATGISKSSIWTSLSKTKAFIKNSYDKDKKEQEDSNNVLGEW